MPMSSERSKSGRESQNHTGIWQTANQLKEFARLRIPVDSKADFHLGDRRRRSRRGADTALDRIFQGLLREANRELASLLRDVRAGSDTTRKAPSFATFSGVRFSVRPSNTWCKPNSAILRSWTN